VVQSKKLIHALVSLLALVFLPAYSAMATSVFINEVHYDNASTDAGEAIEIAGPAGTDLTGWSIVLYNGSGGAVYDTDALSGSIPNLGGGYGVVVLNYPSNGIQNGAPDGIALVNASSTVVQFLSYEGTFNAVGGPANGLLSTDIGVSQAGTGATGQSLRLSGTGTQYEDFSWNAEAASTFGAFNTGQSFSATPETAPSVSGTSPANGATAIALDANIVVTFDEAVNAAGSWFEISCDTSGLHTAAASGGPASFTLDPDTDFANDETCTVTVFAAQVTDQDATDPPDNMAANHVFSFDTEVAINNDWNINEIHADPDATNGDANGDGVLSTTQDEFVEIVNNSGSDVNISGWTLSDAVGVRHTFPAGSVVYDSCAVVVFAGGSLAGNFGYSRAQTASSGQLGLNNGGDTVTLANGATTVATYTYGAEGGDNQSLTRDPDVSITPLVKHTLATGAAGTRYSPGRRVDGSAFAGCPTPQSAKIHDVQGSGETSPLAGNVVVIEGIVTGDFQGGASGTHGNLQGFYVQEEDADADADPQTSEGIFIFDGNNPATNVAEGDLVRVLGPVSEFNGLTEITSFNDITVISSGHGLPAVIELSLPVTDIAEFEAFESMYVTFPQALAIAEYFNFDRFGEVVLSTARLAQPTAVFDPGSLEQGELADLNNRSQITLDDGRSNQNPDPAIHPNGSEFTLLNLFRGGDTVEGATGVLDYRFSLYRIQPTLAGAYTSVNPRTALPDDVGGSVQVSSFNVLNYFNGNGVGGGFPTSRGAANLVEFNRQRDKIIAAMVAIDADVFGLMEIENDGYGATSAIQDLVNGLNNATAPGTFAFVDPGVPVIGTDEIAVGLIYKPASVSPLGSSAILDSSVDPLFLDDKNRPVLAQTFGEVAGNGVFTVAINHLKSKGTDCNDVGDPDLGDGAGNCNMTREDAAMALVDWLDSDPTGSNDADFIILGDLNSYDKEDPIDVLVGAGYSDLAAEFGGEFAYSYVFDGQLGYLDYALASPVLSPQVSGATEWHINADEADLIDYTMTFKAPAQDAIYAPDPYRSSDHDPVIAGIELLGYEFSGFIAPIKNLPEMNSQKSGGAIPVKFSLDGFQGMDVIVEGYPQSQAIACDHSSSGESIATTSPGGSVLIYDQDKDQYVYTWQTSKEWSGSCRRLVVLLKDGSYHYADFMFK
jgi:predicted extracellular nuclease